MDSKETISELKRFPHVFPVWFTWNSQAAMLTVLQVQNLIFTQAKAPFVTVHCEFKCIA